MIKPTDEIKYVPGRKWYESTDPDLALATKRSKGALVMWIGWMLGGGLPGGITAAQIARCRGQKNESGVKKQLDRVVDEQNEKIEAGEDPLIRVKTNAYRSKYRILVRMDVDELAEGPIPIPDHAGEFIRCLKCGKFSRYLGLSNKRKLNVYAHGHGMGGMKEKVTFCLVNLEKEIQDRKNIPVRVSRSLHEDIDGDFISLVNEEE